MSAVNGMNSRNEAMQELAAFQAAYSSLDYESAFEHIARALEKEPAVVWHEIVREHGAAFHIAFGSDDYFSPRNDDDRAGRRRHDRMAALLDRLHGRCPEMILVPPTTTEESVQHHRELRQACIDDGSPYFLFISQEKSGTTAFGNIIPSGFGLPCVTYGTPASTVIPAWARDCARGGGTYVTHMRPHPENVATLHSSGLDRAIVHTRDPRQIYLSALHHVELYKEEVPALAARGYFSLDFAGKARFQLAMFDHVVAWINGWMRAGEQGGLAIEFTCYEDFVLNRDATVERLLAFYGGDMKRFRAERAFATHENVDYHFRRGEIDEWRHAFDKSLIAELNARMPPAWFDKFPWEP